MFKFCLLLAVVICVKAQYDYDDLSDIDIQNSESDLQDTLHHSEGDLDHAMEAIEALDIKQEDSFETTTTLPELAENTTNVQKLPEQVENQTSTQRPDVTTTAQNFDEVSTSSTTTTTEQQRQHFLLGKKIKLNV